MCAPVLKCRQLQRGFAPLTSHRGLCRWSPAGGSAPREPNYGSCSLHSSPPFCSPNFKLQCDALRWGVPGLWTKVGTCGSPLTVPSQEPKDEKVSAPMKARPYGAIQIQCMFISSSSKQFISHAKDLEVLLLCPRRRGIKWCRDPSVGPSWAS